MTPPATHEPARIPSIPRDTAEGRELLQARIASFGCVATWLTLGFGAMGGGLLTVADMGEHAWQVKATAAHLSAALVYGAIWLVARRPAPLSPRLDAGARRKRPDARRRRRPASDGRHRPPAPLSRINPAA